MWSKKFLEESWCFAFQDWSSFPDKLWVNPKRFNDPAQHGLASNSLLLLLSYRSLQSRLCCGSSQTSWNLSCIRNTVNTTKQPGVKNDFSRTKEVRSPLGVSAWTGKQSFTELRNSCTPHFSPIHENTMNHVLVPLESNFLMITRNFFCHHLNFRTPNLKKFQSKGRFGLVWFDSPPDHSYSWILQAKIAHCSVAMLEMVVKAFKHKGLTLNIDIHIIWMTELRSPD